MSLLSGRLPSVKTTATYKPDKTYLKDSKIPKDQVKQKKLEDTKSQFLENALEKKKTSFWSDLFEQQQKIPIPETIEAPKLLRLQVYRQKKHKLGDPGLSIE